ncbi:MAG: hypothetical protein OEV15_05560, partial [Gallionella sp.]|nr:hypothetical protein [Gallionella sp.]
IASNLSIQDAVWHVKSAKFPQPARPGDTVTASYTLAPGGEIRFECAVAGNKVLSGIACNHPASGSTL